MADGACTRTEKLSSRRSRRFEQLGINPKIVAWPDPAIRVSVEERLSRHLREVVAARMPEPPVEHDRRAGGNEERNRPGTQCGAVRGASEGVASVTAGNHPQ